NVVPYPVEDAWLTVTEAAAPLAAVPPTTPSGSGLDAHAFQNLGYTAEWFVFAAFAAFMWFKLFRREVEARRDAELGIAPDAPTSASPSSAPESSSGGVTRQAAPA